VDAQAGEMPGCARPFGYVPRQTHECDAAVLDARTPRRRPAALIESVLAHAQAAAERVERTWLPAEKKTQYLVTLVERAKALRNEQG